MHPRRAEEAAAPIGPAYENEPLGIIAAGGDLPRILAEGAVMAGFRPIVARFADGIGAGWADDFGARDFRWGEAGDAIAWFQSEKVRRVVSGGTVSVRPDFRAVRPTWRTLQLLHHAIRIMRGGDDSVLKRTARFLEGRGFELMAVQDLAPQLLMPSGYLGRRVASPDERAALALAARAARTIGILDAGQAAVASQQRVIAMEGIEGTREMLQRVGDLAKRGRIGAREVCVLVKAVKPGQDRRFDLPSIGAATVREAAEAGIRGIGLTAGYGLVIGFEDLVAAADAADVFVVGVEPDDEQLAGDAP